MLGGVTGGAKEESDQERKLPDGEKRNRPQRSSCGAGGREAGGRGQAQG